MLILFTLHYAAGPCVLLRWVNVFRFLPAGKMWRKFFWSQIFLILSSLSFNIKLYLEFFSFMHCHICWFGFWHKIILILKYHIVSYNKDFTRNCSILYFKMCVTFCFNWLVFICFSSFGGSLFIFRIFFLFLFFYFFGLFHNLFWHFYTSCCSPFIMWVKANRKPNYLSPVPVGVSPPGNTSPFGKRWRIDYFCLESEITCIKETLCCISDNGSAWKKKYII